MYSQLVSANPKGANPKGANTTGTNPIGVSPLLIPQGQVRIYLGAAHRFIWPVHLAGWLELGWTTEPPATPAATAGANGPGATPVATRTASKTRRSNKEKNPTNENPIGASPLDESPLGANAIGGGSAKEVDPLPPTHISVAVTDFTVDESNPTLEADD
jgi:hypothetical protein